jgi:DNA-binding transcriptional LysR family regulator
VELKHLRYFVTLAEEMHFGRAAARLQISQPPLSQMVKRLEDELGVALFRRTSRSVELTEPGRLFLEEARRTLSHAEHSVRVARQANGGEIGHLEIGFVPACGVFPEAVRTFAARHPGVKLSLRHTSSAEQLSAVARGALDVGFVHLPVGRDGLLVEEVQRNSLLVALPEGHELTSRHVIPWRALNGQRFVGFPRASAPEAYDALLLRLRQAGFHPEVAYETDSLLARLRIVAAGFGVSLVPD